MPTRSFPMLALALALYIGSACLFIFFMTGCQTSAPKVSGGRSAVELPDGTSVASRQGDNAETPTTQLIVRESKRTIPTPPAAHGEPTRLMQFPPVVEETHTERIETTVGATQDVAGIMKVVGNYRDTIWSFLIAAALIWIGVVQWRKRYTIATALSGIGTVVTLYTMSPWWGLGSIAASLLIWVVWTIAEKSNPVAGAAGTIVRESFRPPADASGSD